MRRAARPYSSLIFKKHIYNIYNSNLRELEGLGFMGFLGQGRQYLFDLGLHLGFLEGVHLHLAVVLGQLFRGACLLPLEEGVRFIDRRALLVNEVDRLHEACIIFHNV